MGNALGSAGGAFDPSGGIYPQLLLDSDGNINSEGGYGKSMRQLYVAAPTTPDANNGNGLSYNMYHTPVPKIWQYNVTVQHEFDGTMMASVAYVGRHGYNLNFPVDINQVPQSELSVTDITPGSNKRPYPNFTGLGGSTNNGISNYNSFQAVFQKRLPMGWNSTQTTPSPSSWILRIPLVGAEAQVHRPTKVVSVFPATTDHPTLTFVMCLPSPASTLCPSAGEHNSSTRACLRTLYSEVGDWRRPRAKTQALPSQR